MERDRESAKIDAFATRLTGTPDALRLDGTKFYTTGSLFADSIDVGATDQDGVSVPVSRHAAGVEVHDDWDGIGQTLTASGTAVFHHVAAMTPRLLAKADVADRRILGAGVAVPIRFGVGPITIAGPTTLPGWDRDAAARIGTALGAPCSPRE